VQAAPVPMPGALRLQGHALQTSAGMFQAILLIVGICVIGLGINYLRERPHDGFLKGTLWEGVPEED
jgi:hypothetical protein